MPLRLAFFNHLLEQHPTVREALSAYAGRVIVWQLPLKALHTVVTEEGWLADSQATGEVTVHIPQHALFSILSRRGIASDELRYDGDPELGRAAGALLSDLYWDATDDLSRLVGDAPAHLVGKALSRGHRLLTRAEENIVDQLQEPSAKTLVRRHEIATFTQKVCELRDCAEQLQVRLSRLEEGQGKFNG